ncbi:RNA-directed DNA polymerase, eukaryota [Tanacetum coccineum]
MGSFRSKEDDVAKISTSIFVSNFPDSVSAKDLFHSYKQYGHGCGGSWFSVVSLASHDFTPEGRIAWGDDEDEMSFLSKSALDLELKKAIGWDYRVLEDERDDDLSEREFISIGEQADLGFLHIDWRGILCIWDPNSFRKDSVTVSDYFVIVRGVWIKSGMDILIVVVYAHMMFEINRLIMGLSFSCYRTRAGEVVMMAILYEVRYKSDRFGSNFNAHGFRNISKGSVPNFKEEYGSWMIDCCETRNFFSALSKQVWISSAIQNAILLCFSEFTFEPDLSRKDLECMVSKEERGQRRCAIAEQDKSPNGDNTSFWKDKWHNEGVLKDVFPRLYALERHQNVTIHTKLIDYSLVNSFRRNPRSGVEEFQLDNLSRLVSTITLSSAVDRYVWSLENSGEFSVKSIRQVIDANCFPVIHSATRWVKSVPLKVNIMAWKIKMDGLPTRMNISRRGIEIDSIVCPICNSGAESSCHIFFQCNLVRQLARKISSWWNVDYVDVSSYEELYTWLVSLRLQANLKAVFEGIFYCLWWSVCRMFVNKIISEKVSLHTADGFLIHCF